MHRPYRVRSEGEGCDIQQSGRESITDLTRGTRQAVRFSAWRSRRAELFGFGIVRAALSSHGRLRLGRLRSAAARRSAKPALKSCTCRSTDSLWCCRAARGGVDLARELEPDPPHLAGVLAVAVEEILDRQLDERRGLAAGAADPGWG